MMNKNIIFIFFISFLYGGESTIRYGYSDLHAFLMQKNSIQILTEYNKLNDTLDVLNIKEQELGTTLSSFGSIGDFDGVFLGIRYRNNSSRMYNLSISSQSIGYGENNLRNRVFQGYVRQKIYSNKYSRINAMSFDLGVIANRASDISYSKKSFLENLVKKVFDVQDAKIIDNGDGTYSIGIIKQDGSTEFINNLIEEPKLYIKNMSDITYYMQLLAEKRFSNKFLASLYLKGGFTQITSSIQANSDLTEKAAQKNYETLINLDRNEKFIETGINISWDIDLMIIEINYSYLHLFREQNLNYVNYNHIINVSFEIPVSESILLYTSGKFMYRQFNGEIPYLYNKYTQTTFDHKYGYATFGVIYNF